MRPAELILTRLRAAGITVEAHGDRLRLVPAARLTPELDAQVCAWKPALIRWLTWSYAEADRLLDAALDRIGRATPAIEQKAFDHSQRPDVRCAGQRQGGSGARVVATGAFDAPRSV